MELQQIGKIFYYLVEMEDSCGIMPAPRTVDLCNAGCGLRWLGAVKAVLWICIGVASAVILAKLTST